MSDCLSHAGFQPPHIDDTAQEGTAYRCPLYLMYEDFPKRESIKGRKREYGKKHIKKYFARIHRKSERNKVRTYNG
jgi:hypothetical protein